MIVCESEADFDTLDDAQGEVGIGKLGRDNLTNENEADARAKRKLVLEIVETSRCPLGIPYLTSFSNNCPIFFLSPASLAALSSLNNSCSSLSVSLVG